MNMFLFMPLVPYHPLPLHENRQKMAVQVAEGEARTSTQGRQLVPLRSGPRFGHGESDGFRAMVESDGGRVL